MSVELKIVGRTMQMSLFGTMPTTADAIKYAEAHLPKTPNEMFTLLMIYHNTLLKQLNEDGALK